MKIIKIDCNMHTMLSNPLQFEIIINNRSYFKGQSGCGVISLDFEYDETCVECHDFRLIISGKRALIDSIDDTQSTVELSQLSFNGFDVRSMIDGVFIHNHNGFGDLTKEKPGTVFGIDGELQFKIYTPVSYWVAKDYPY